MVGSTSVDFAGTLDEAMVYAEKHRSEFPRTFNVWRGNLRSPNGDPLLYASWKSAAEHMKVRSALEALGWGSESQQDHFPRKKWTQTT